MQKRIKGGGYSSHLCATATAEHRHNLPPFFTAANAANAYAVMTQENMQATSNAAANGCPNGCPAFFAYGSILDNLSGGATTLESQFPQALTTAAINCIYNATCKGSFNLHRAVKH